MERNQPNLDEVVSVPVDGELRREISEMARAEDRKIGPMARVLIKEAVAARRQLRLDDDEPDKPNDKRISRKPSRVAA